MTPPWHSRADHAPRGTLPQLLLGVPGLISALVAPCMEPRLSWNCCADQVLLVPCMEILPLLGTCGLIRLLLAACIEPWPLLSFLD